MSDTCQPGAALDRAVPGRKLVQWATALPMAALLALLAVHAAGVVLDLLAAIRSPLEFDYGEGIVWQQAALIPGPRMYSDLKALPFIVFEYPPLYHLLARAALLVEPNFLAAGRLVSALSALLIAPAVAGLVLVSVRRPGRRFAGAEVWCAVAAGLLVLCLHAVRTWGGVMRVDMVAVAFGLYGLLLGIRADGRFAGTAAALLLCLAAVFAKQTQLPAGAAVFLVALVRRPRSALGAAGLVGAVGLGALGFMQWLTGGGFLHNIVNANVDRFALSNVLFVLWPERTSLIIVILMLISAGAVLASLSQPPAGFSLGALTRCIPGIRSGDPATLARSMLLLHAFLSGLMLFAVFKSGSGYNYLLPCLCTGCVLIGVRLCDLAATGQRLASGAGLLILGLLLLPFRQLPDQPPHDEVEQRAALVRRIAATDKPVASDDMTLLMQAGKPMIFEPAIIAELASLGRWDEAPLIGMIRTHGFAFMLTTSDDLGGNASRTASVDAAMREAYPHVEQVSRRLWLHTPAGS